MKKTAGIVLLALGILAIVYGGFTYTTKKHEVDLGPVEFSVREQERVNIPLWAGLITVAAGAGLIMLPHRRSRRG